MPSGRKEGNPGNKGGGRPSVKETEWHLNKWQEDTLVEELEQKILSKKYSIRDMWLLMALKGNDKIIRQAADKVLANLIDLRGKDGEALGIPILHGVIPSDNSNKENPKPE